MHLLDICDDVLLDILSLVDPIDLVNIYNVCERLRALAEKTINKVVINLQLTGTKCFPYLKPRPFDNLDRIRVNKNWVDGKFKKTILFPNNESIYCGIFVDFEHLYVKDAGAIRKYDRLWNGEYLSSDFKLIGSVEDPDILLFEKKDNVIFAGCYKGIGKIFQDEKPATERVAVSSRIQCLDLFPKNDIYVAATETDVQILNKSLLPLEKIDKGSRCVKINPEGEKLVMGHGERLSRTHISSGTLYDLGTKNKVDLDGLNGAADLLWKDNKTFLSGHDDGSLRLYDLRTNSVCQRIDSLKGDYIHSVQFDGQNTALCGFARSRSVSFCDLRMSKEVKKFHVFESLEELRRHQLIHIVVADPKHLFVVADFGLQICDFS